MKSDNQEVRHIEVTVKVNYRPKSVPIHVGEVAVRPTTNITNLAHLMNHGYMYTGVERKPYQLPALPPALES